MQHKNEQILDWLEAADRGGLSLSLSQLNHLLSCAPPGAQKTPEYSYLEGFRDCKFLTEQIGIGGQKMKAIKDFFKTKIPHYFATLSRAWFWGFLFGAGTYYFVTTLAKIKGVTI